MSKKEKRLLAKAKKETEREREEKRSRAKRLILFLLVLSVVGLLGFKLVTFLASPAPKASSEVAVKANDWIKGDPAAAVTLVEFADFQCPACASYADAIDNLTDEIPGLAIVFRHFPLTSIHPNAMPASLSAEAAGRQGQFWQMHDLLFQRQKEWAELSNPTEAFVLMASELGLDGEKFLVDYESDEVKEKVMGDLNLAGRLFLTSTPTFFLNGKRVSLPLDPEEIKKIILKEIDRIGAN